MERPLEEPRGVSRAQGSLRTAVEELGVESSRNPLSLSLTVGIRKLNLKAKRVYLENASSIRDPFSGHPSLKPLTDISNSTSGGHSLNFTEKMQLPARPSASLGSSELLSTDSHLLLTGLGCHSFPERLGQRETWARQEGSSSLLWENLFSGCPGLTFACPGTGQ